MLQQGDVDEVSRALTLTEQSATRAKALIRDIEALTTSDVDAGSVQLDDIRTVIQEVCDDLRSMAQSRHVGIRTDMEDVGRTMVSAVAVRQMVHNLVINAITYADPLAEDAGVQVTLTRGAEMFRIAVEDNGVGIEPGHREQLFQMFTRFRPDLGDGSGLGLYLVRKLAQRHGGSVHYEPLKPGSRFTVTIPVDGRTPR